MPDQRCKNCRHWSTDEGLDGICDRIRHPDDDDGQYKPENFKAIDLHGCEFAAGVVEALVIDAEGYSASLLTTPDFGCVLWECSHPDHGPPEPLPMGLRSHICPGCGTEMIYGNLAESK